MVEQRDINWELIRKQLPFERTKAQKELRIQLWKRIDSNHDSHVTLAELDKGLKNVLHCYQVFQCKPVIIKAFTLAKNANTKRQKHGNYYIDFSEFRLVLLYLRQYFEYFQAFARIDIDDDRQISKNEFMKSIGKIELWTGPIKRPKKEFELLDTNRDDLIDFDEFCVWAVKKNLDLHDDDD